MAAYDLAVIGAGPGGYTAALRAARLSKRVALIERDAIGGVCLNRGCIPTKALVATARRMRMCQTAEEFGILLGGDPQIDFSRAQARKRDVVDRLRGGLTQLIASAGIDLIRGSARLATSGAIEIDGASAIDAEHVILATGSRWIDLPTVPCDGKLVVTSDDALEWTRLPASVCVVGGGYIGCEFASLLSACGVAVTIVEATENLLPAIDRVISKELARAFGRRGITIKTGTTVERIERTDDGVRLLCARNESVDAERVLVAVGRRPHADDLGVADRGIAVDGRGAVAVDGRFATAVDGIYAIGDVIGQAMLAHVAAEQAIACVDGIFADGPSFDGRCIPACVFTDPEIATVGATAEELVREGANYTAGRFVFAALGKAQADGAPEGQVTVYGDERGRIRGVHAIGEGAAEMIAEATLAMHAGMSVRDLGGTIHAHPTRAEALAEAARDVYGAAIHKAARRMRKG